MAQVYDRADATFSPEHERHDVLQNLERAFQRKIGEKRLQVLAKRWEDVVALDAFTRVKVLISEKNEDHRDEIDALLQSLDYLYQSTEGLNGVRGVCSVARLYHECGQVERAKDLVKTSYNSVKFVRGSEDAILSCIELAETSQVVSLDQQAGSAWDTVLDQISHVNDERSISSFVIAACLQANKKHIAQEAISKVTHGGRLEDIAKTCITLGEPDLAVAIINRNPQAQHNVGMICALIEYHNLSFVLPILRGRTWDNESLEKICLWFSREGFVREFLSFAPPEMLSGESYSGVECACYLSAYPEHFDVVLKLTERMTDQKWLKYIVEKLIEYEQFSHAAEILKRIDAKQHVLDIYQALAKEGRYDIAFEHFYTVHTLYSTNYQEMLLEKIMHESLARYPDDADACHRVFEDLQQSRGVENEDPYVRAMYRTSLIFAAATQEKHIYDVDELFFHVFRDIQKMGDHEKKLGLYQSLMISAEKLDHEGFALRAVQGILALISHQEVNKEEIDPLFFSQALAIADTYGDVQSADQLRELLSTCLQKHRDEYSSYFFVHCLRVFLTHGMIREAADFIKYIDDDGHRIMLAQQFIEHDDMSHALTLLSQLEETAGMAGIFEYLLKNNRLDEARQVWACIEPLGAKGVCSQIMEFAAEYKHTAFVFELFDQENDEYGLYRAAKMYVLHEDFSVVQQILQILEKSENSYAYGIVEACILLDHVQEAEEFYRFLEEYDLGRCASLFVRHGALEQAEKLIEKIQSPFERRRIRQDMNVLYAKRYLAEMARETPNDHDKVAAEQLLRIYAQGNHDQRKFILTRALFGLNPKERNLFIQGLPDHEQKAVAQLYQHGSSLYIEQIFQDVLDKEDLRFLQKIRLDLSPLYKDWSYGKTPALIDRVELNLSVMSELEHRRPGSVQLLYESYGISHFGRYPISILEDMVEYHGKSVPYGVYLTTRYDHNGAFYQNGGQLEKFVEKLQPGTHLRIVEAGSKLGILHKLMRLHKLYGNEHKISYMLVGAHGSPDGLAFGDHALAELRDFRMSDIGKRTAQVLRDEVFVHNIPAAFFSCSTGVEGGIAQQLRNTLSANITAPDASTYSQSFFPVYKDDKMVSIQVQYATGTAKNYTP